MKRLSIVILAVLLALTTVLAASCAAPPSEARGEKGDNPAKGMESATDVPDTTDLETTGDSGTVKDEETTLPEETDSSNDETSAEDATEPDDTDAEVLHETEPVAPPETEPVAPPETEPVAPPETEPVAPPETEPVAPPETEPVAPPETEPVVQQPVPIDDAVLDQIAKDYYYYIMERYNRDPNDMVPYYVNSYYGTYDGVVIVNFQCAVEGNHSLVFVEVNIAGYIFCLSPNSINVWKDGEFYSFKEAYDLGVLTADQIGQINGVTSVKYDKTEHIYPSSFEPVPPAEGILDQIAKDYYYTKLEKYNGDPSNLGSFYISSYFGTYDGAVPVILNSTVKADIPTIVTEEKIAGYSFWFAGVSIIEVWKDGTFYSLKDAYDLGILTADQIGQINGVTSVKYDKTEHIYPSSFEPVPPAEGILDQIAKDYYYYALNRFYENDPNRVGQYFVFKYYGTYDGAVPVIINGSKEAYLTSESQETVAGHTILYPSGNFIKVWKDGEFYSLQEAYDLGILTADQIGQISQVNYLKYNSSDHIYPK